MNELAELLRQGKFREALTKLEELPNTGSYPSSELFLVTRAELLERTGRVQEALKTIRSIHELKENQVALRARCSIIEGRIARRKGHLIEAVDAFQRARHLAAKVGDQEYYCWANLRLMKTTSELSGPEAVALTRAELGRLISQLGSVDLTVAYHVFCAEIAARRGLLSESRKLTDLARSLIARTPNVWLRSLLSLQCSCLLYLEGAFGASLLYAANALQTADISGDADCRVASLTDLAACYLALGQVSRSSRCIAAALSRSQADHHSQVLLVETLAEAKLTEGDLNACQELLLSAQQMATAQRQLAARRRAGDAFTKEQWST